MEYIKYIIFLTFIAFVSCKSLEEPMPENGTNVFYIKGRFNQDNITFVAGNDDYYLYASHAKDNKNVYEFKSDLKPPYCTSCSNSMQIAIRNYKVSTDTDTTININEAIKAGEYVYKDDYIQPSHRIIKFEIDSATNPNGNFTWDFGDGSTGYGIDPIHAFLNDAKFPVLLDASYQAGVCQSTAAKTVDINLSSAVTGEGCMRDFSYEIRNNTQVFFKINELNVGYNTKVIWYFGDGNFSTSQQDTITHVFAAPGKYTAAIVIIKDSICSDTIAMAKTVDLLGNSCPVGFNYERLNPEPEDELHLSKITVSWKDQNGVLYSSNKLAQPSWSNFQITDIQPYKNNEKEEKTIKFKVRFNCRVYNDHLQAVDIRDAEGVIAVSYP